MKEYVEDLEDIPLEKGREVIIAESKKRNDGVKPITFIEDDSFEIPTVFPPKFPDLGSFTIPCVVGKTKIERAICDLVASGNALLYVS